MDREKGVRFFHLPSVITHQRVKTHDLSKKWYDCDSQGYTGRTLGQRNIRTPVFVLGTL